MSAFHQGLLDGESSYHSKNSEGIIKTPSCLLKHSARDESYNNNHYPVISDERYIQGQSSHFPTQSNRGQNPVDDIEEKTSIYIASVGHRSFGLRSSSSQSAKPCTQTGVAYRSLPRLVYFISRTCRSQGGIGEIGIKHKIKVKMRSRFGALFSFLRAFSLRLCHHVREERRQELCNVSIVAA